jgi:two-component system, OmpR family, alkaline phosphatase synthesis response regulator PhoP
LNRLKVKGDILMAIRVLMIDDDSEFVEATATILSSRGYEIDSAPNGKAGIAKARMHKPNVILLDVMMTTKTEGFDVAREIHRNKELSDVPVILLTGVKKEMSLPFGFEPDEAWLPVKGVLEKPVKPDVLLKAVADNT